MIKYNTIGILAALGSAASWSIGTLLFKQLGKSLSSFAMTLAQGAVSVIILGLLTLMSNGYGSIERDACLYLSLSGFLGIAVSGTFFFRALKELSAQAISLLFMLGQVITILFAVLLLDESLSVFGWVGIILIIVGVTIGVFPGNYKSTHSSPYGIGLGLISIFLMSTATILTKKGLSGEVSTLYATFIRMLAGTIGILFIGILTRRLGGWIAPFRDIQLIFKFTLTVCIITLGGFWLAIVAFKYANVSVASSLISTEPIFILQTSVLFTKSNVTFRSIAGACIAIFGVIALCISSNNMY